MAWRDPIPAAPRPPPWVRRRPGWGL